MNDTTGRTNWDIEVYADEQGREPCRAWSGNRSTDDSPRRQEREIARARRLMAAYRLAQRRGKS